MTTKDILVAVIGLDQPGVVAATAETLTRLDCNIEQMTQTTLRHQFTSIYLVNKPEGLDNDNIVLELRTAFQAKKFHLSVSIRDYEEPKASQVIEGEPFVISVWGPDRNDIIGTFARICAEQSINVESLKAFRIENDQSRCPRHGGHSRVASCDGRTRQGDGVTHEYATCRHFRSDSPRARGLIT